MSIKREIQSEDEEEAASEQQQVNIPPKNVIRPGLYSRQLPPVRDAEPGVKRRSMAEAGNDSASVAKSFGGYENRISRRDSRDIYCAF